MLIVVIKQVHVKSINVTIKRVTKRIQRIEDMDAFIYFLIFLFVISTVFAKNISVLPHLHLR